MFCHKIKQISKTVLTLVVMFMVGVTFTCALTVDEVSAAAFSTTKKVTGVKVTAKSYNSVTLKWSKMKNAKGYQLYRATSKNGRYKKIKTTSKTSYKNTGLTTGKTYYYKVRAYKKSGKRTKYSKYSSKVRGAPALGKPSASVSADGTTATVKWKKVSGAKGYQVYRKTGSGSYSRVKTTGGISFRDTGLADGKTYTYKVRAYRKAGKSVKYSAYSTAVKITARAKHTCTVSIDCATLAGDMSKLTNKDSAKYVPRDGWMIRDMKVEFTTGESVYDVLVRACRQAGYPVAADYTQSYGSYYIEGINRLYEFDAGPLSGWMYNVNGKYPTYGCSAYKVKAGDKVCWRYTCDLGADIGGSNGVR